MDFGLIRHIRGGGGLNLMVIIFLVIELDTDHRRSRRRFEIIKTCVLKWKRCVFHIKTGWLRPYIRTSGLSRAWVVFYRKG